MMTAPRLTVLFIAMEFPPVNTTGNYRALKFIKYLREFGIDPVVVTLKEDQAASLFNTKIDLSLLKEIPENTPIYRVDCDYKNTEGSKGKAFFKMLFRVNDSLAARWSSYFHKEIGSIIERHKPQLIFTSLPPFSSGSLALKVGAAYKLPVITDMRDLWSKWGSTPFLSYIHYLLTFYEEKFVFRKSVRVIGVTPQLVEQFRNSHPDLDKNKFHFIPNGFDSPLDRLEDFEFKPGKKIIIGYVGSFYYHPEDRNNSMKPWWRKKRHKMLQYHPVKEDWLYRSPYFFFKTIAKLLHHFPGLSNRIELHFVGNKTYWFDGMLTEFSLHNHIVSHGFVSSSRASELQDTFDLILATSEKVIGEDHYCLPSKIFDYVGRKKPLLGFVTRGIQRDFIEQSGLGIICDPDDDEQAAAVLYDLILNGKKFKVNSEYLASYHRRNIAKNLSQVMTSVAAKKE
jgi:glycosyltransferase involved in cell wall biosynthesis